MASSILAGDDGDDDVSVDPNRAYPSESTEYAARSRFYDLQKEYDAQGDLLEHQMEAMEEGCILDVHSADAGESGKKPRALSKGALRKQPKNKQRWKVPVTKLVSETDKKQQEKTTSKVASEDTDTKIEKAEKKKMSTKLDAKSSRKTDKQKQDKKNPEAVAEGISRKNKKERKRNQSKAPSTKTIWRNGRTPRRKDDSKSVCRCHHPYEEET